MVDLGVLLPDIAPGSGGHRKVLSFCNYFSEKGGSVEIAFASGKSNDELTNIVENNYFINCGKIRNYAQIPIKCNKAVATHWSTSYEVAEWGGCQEKFYFIQDFEPLFYPMSTEYIKAYNSYKLDLKPICFGKWIRNFLLDEFNIHAPYIRFPVNKSIYKPKSNLLFKNGFLKNHSEQQRVLFYARPSQPRRLFSLGIESLIALNKINNNIEIAIFGEDISDNSLPSNIKNLGKFIDLNELAKLYCEATFGIAFSSTNPSLIPFEMLSSGLPVLDVETGRSIPDLETCKAYIRCEPNGYKIAERLNNILNTNRLPKHMSRSATRWSRRLPSEKQFCKDVLDRLNISI